jgi:hypothetical protein
LSSFSVCELLYNLSIFSYFNVRYFRSDNNRQLENQTGVGEVLCVPGDTSLCATSQQDIGNVFVGIYMTFFSLVLIFQELVELMQCSGPSLMMKKNFGFLYGVHGKSSYHIFMAILPSGLVGVSLRAACGITVGLWGILHTLWYCKWPDHFVKYKKYNPATDD